MCSLMFSILVTCTTWLIACSIAGPAYSAISAVSIDMAVERQMGDEFERGFSRVDMDVIVHLIGHFGHFRAGGDALLADQQLGAVDVDDLVDPGRGAAEEALDDGADQRLVGSRQRILPGLVDVQHRAARFQDAEMVAFDRQQRAGDDAFVDDFDRRGSWCRACRCRRAGAR